MAMGENRGMQRVRALTQALWAALRDIVHGRARRRQPIIDAAGLEYFVRTRASHVTQTSLYGYLRARAGTRYPELFNDDEFLKSVNMAKWQVWLACVSDLSVYAGGMICRRGGGHVQRVGTLMQGMVERLLDATGMPSEAGPEFSAHRDRVRARVALCQWAAITDDETAFAESPAALVHWAPVVEDYKQLDQEIVRNSIRFRWQEVRQELRDLLDAQSVLASEGAGAASHNAPGGCAGRTEP